MQEEQKQPDALKTPQKKSFVKKFVKAILCVFGGFVVLNILLYALLSIPAIQQGLVKFALSKLKPMLNTEIRIDEVRLSLFNRVNLKGVYIEDQSKDTLLYAGNVDVQVNLRELLNNKLVINGIKLEDFSANISKKDSASNFNFQFIIDAFSDTTSVAKDTTSSSLKIDIEDIALKNGKLRYDILSQPSTPNLFNASHIAISGLNAQLQLPSIDIRDLSAKLVSISFKEQSGFEVKNLKAELSSNISTVFAKDIELTLNNSSLVIPTAQYNLLTDEFAVNSDQSVISPKDVVPFMADLKHLKHDVIFKTSIKGKLPSLFVDSLTLNYGQQTTLHARASISDYSKYGTADINLGISLLRITPDAIADFARIGDSTFVAPDIIKTMEAIRLKGNVHGSFSNINLNAEAWIKQGSLQLSGKGSIDTTFQNFRANAKLRASSFNLGALLKNPDLGRLSGNIDLLASQSTKQSLKADVKGTITSLQYNNENYDNIPFTAYYNATKMGATIDADLPVGKILAKADMTQAKNPVIDLDLSLANLRVDKFVDSLGWEKPELTFDLKGRIEGLDINKMQANVVVSNFVFSRDSISFRPGVFSLEMQSEDPLNKLIKISSSVFEAEINGQYNLLTLTSELTDLMHQYLPGIFDPAQNKRPKLDDNNFNFSLTVDNTQDLGKVLGLPFNVVKPLLLAGKVNTVDKLLMMQADIPFIDFDGIEIKNTYIDVTNVDSILKMNTSTQVFHNGTEYELTLQSTLACDTINNFITVKADTTGLDIRGELNALAHFGKTSSGSLLSSLQFKPTLLNVGKLNLSFMPATITNEGSKTAISNFGFMLGRGRMMSKYLGIDGIISDQKQDTLNVSFFNAHISEVLQAFDVKNVSAIAHGDIRLTNILNSPEFFTNNFIVSDIIMFGDTLGTLSLTSQLDDAMNTIKLDAILAKDKLQSEIKGIIDPGKGLMDLDININKLSVKWLQPFMDDLLNKVSGSVSAKLKAKGKFSAPDVSGWMGFNDTSIGVDYTNVTYRISDTIQITPQKIGFDNLVIEDSYKNKGTLNALVTHKGFEDMHYSLDMNMNNLMVLNTAGRTDSLFYGKVFASGTVSIKGSDAGIDMNMHLRNGKGSLINIQIPQTSDASSYQSIVYINTPKTDDIDSKIEPVIKTESGLPIKMEIDLTVTPDIELGVVINPETGDALQVKGSGLIKFTYDLQSEAMNTFGNYTISEGNVKLKLQNISTLAFNIKEGSKLTFNGDPLKTSFDIHAYRKIKSDLTTLSASFADDQSNSTKVDANCVLGISGDVSKMNLTYDVTVPNASDDVQQRVRSLISTDGQKVKQFAYLLALGSFYPERGNSAAPNITGGLLTSIASSTLSQGLNTLFGSVLGNKWQIGTNISSNDGSFNNMDMSVSLSRKYLDDKLEFSTNLGYRTDQSANGNNSLIGDFDVAYALNRLLKIRAFNKTNDRYYKQAPITQGIGIVYTKEAKKIKDLFKVFIKKRKRPAERNPK